MHFTKERAKPVDVDEHSLITGKMVFAEEELAGAVRLRKVARQKNKCAQPNKPKRKSMRKIRRHLPPRQSQHEFRPGQG